MLRSLAGYVCALAVAISFTVPTVGGHQEGRRRGKISGVVYNVATGAPLLRAVVEVVGSADRSETGIDGEFTIEAEPGTYSIRFSRRGFLEQTFDDVVVASGAVAELNAVLTPEGYGESVTVAAGRNGDVASMIEDRKSSATVSDTISRVEISNDTSSSAAGVLQRVPGVTVVDRFVFVRGLGERYSNTSLNDSLLPTTEPDRKVVPMDLIPADLLQSVRILKTFSPDQPGEFGGGVVRLDTIEFPKAASLSVSFSLGINSQTTGKGFFTYPQGSSLKNFFGFGRGDRQLPPGIPENERLLRGNQFLPGGFTPEELQTIGRSFRNIWEPRTENARPEVGWSVSGGQTFGKFGLVGSLSFKNELQSQDERRIYYQVAQGGVVLPQHLYDYSSSTQTARLGGALNLNYQLTDNHKLFFKNFLTNQATDETRIFEGFNDDRRTDLLNTRLRYIEERISTHQITGDHVLKWLGDSILTWRYTYSRATLDEPDLRETLYEFNQNVDEFIFFNQTQSLFRLFNEMDENVREPAADWAKFWFKGQLAINAKAGFSFINRDRVFDSRRFRFVPRSLFDIDLSLPAEQLLAPDNINPDRFEIREETRTTDHYDALHNITAGYLMADVSLRNWRFVGGARVEKSEQSVTTFEPFRPEVIPLSATLKDTDVLPSLGIAYSTLGGNMNFRLGFSRTVARPQFRELSPFEFTDVTGGRSTVGNPNLGRTLLTNYDLRWEWFFGTTELLAVSAFHKDMDDPIETVIEPTAQLRTSFRNVDAARNTGVEFEVRKRLGGFWGALENMAVNANYTYVRSRVDIGEQELSVLTTLQRPLVGQAEHVVNVILSHDLPRWDIDWRALFNYRGERITDVGALGLPDIIERGYPHLDLLAAKRFGPEKKFRFEFSIKNLLNRQIDFRQADQPFRVYRTGRTVGFGISYKIL